MHLRPYVYSSLAALLIAAAGCASGEAHDLDRPSARECEQLRDHVVDLRLASVTDHRAEHAANLTAALGRGFVVGCQAMTPRSQVRCGRAAADLEALAACAGR